MKIDIEALKELLKSVFLSSTDNSKEAIEKGLNKIDNITLDSDGWVNYDDTSYCLTEE